MSFPNIFNPLTAGYIYGLTIDVTPDNIKKKIIDSPIITTVDLVSTGCVYALTADLASKIFPVSTRGKNILTGVLFAVAGYKLYKLMKKSSESNPSFDQKKEYLLPEPELKLEPELKPEPEIKSESSAKTDNRLCNHGRRSLPVPSTAKNFL
jgi:hypothetical protein